MMELYREIEVCCPVCQMIKEIKVPDQIFKQKKFGMAKIQIPEGGVCADHQFIVFIDNKGIIRGYEKIDLHLRSYESLKRFSLHGFIKLFGLYGLFSLIHAKIFNYNTLSIYDTNIDVEPEIINQLLDDLLPENYRRTNKVNFFQETSYDKIKKIKDALVFDNHQNILQTPWNKKLKFEEEIIRKSLNELNENDQLVMIKKQIAKFVKEVEFVKNIVEKGEIYEDNLIEMISRELMVPKPNHYQIQLIKEFIEKRISIKLAQRIKSRLEYFLNSF